MRKSVVKPPTFRGAPWSYIFPLALLASACGGGGHRNTSSTPTPPTPTASTLTTPTPPTTSTSTTPTPAFPEGSTSRGSTKCRNAHPSLDLGCLSESEYNIEVEKWASHYGGTKGFKNQWGLNMIQADMAYAHLTLSKGADVKPGAGVTIGFMDSGIDLYHPAFRNKNVREIFLDDFPNETINDDGASHGTGVASIAAGDRLSADSPYYNSAGQGVAWGADIVMFARTLEGEGNHILPNSGDDKDDFYVPWTLDQISANDHWDSRHFSDIKNEDIDILNRSIGSYGIIDMYTEEELRDNYGKTIRSWAQAGSEEKMIIVNSAGNDHGEPCRPEDHPANICTYDSELREYMVNAVSPGVIAGLVAYMEELQGHVISVIAVNPDDRLGWRFGGVEDSAGKITSFSNRCGIAADHCIAAPGSNLTVAYFGDGRRDYLRGYDYSLGFHKADDGSYIYGGYGTSYAAPMVSGGLAVMKQLFRSQLSNTQLVKRLFHTANKTGFYANRDIYGQGLMDLGAATNPWGILEFIRDNPTPCMTTTEGCLTQSEYNSDVASLASSYRSWGGQAYRNSSFLDRINADEAYAHLKLIQGISSPASLGKGVRIGFIYWAPTGQGKLYDLHDSIYDKNVTYDDEVSCNSSSCSYYPTMGLLSVALGERYSPSRGMFGVAPGANFYTRPFNSSDSRSDVISYINDLQTNADIIVIPSWSLGDKGAIVGLDNAEATQRINFSRNISDIFVSDVGDKANTLVEESDTGDVLLVMASRSDSLEDNCSGVESICISVPTESDGSIYAADNDHDTDYLYHFTNLSSGVVAGGLAVMKQQFRDQLSASELRDRLFRTSDKSGTYSNSSAYGHGLMDLGAATNPWGILEFIRDNPRDNPTPCMTTTEGCLTQSEYNSDVASLASSYRSWGGQAYRNSSFLDRINADEAYAHLKLIQGISSPASLGKGVRIGFIYWAPTGQGKLYDLHDSIYDKNVTYDDEVSCNSSSCSYYPTMGLLSVALGERYSPSRGMFGVAPGANFYTRPFNSSDSRSDVISYINDLQTNADIIVIPSWSLGDKGAIVGLDNAEATQRINFSRNISDIFVSDVGDKANTLVEESDTGDVLLVMASRSDSLGR